MASQVIDTVAHVAWQCRVLTSLRTKSIRHTPGNHVVRKPVFMAGWLLALLTSSFAISFELVHAEATKPMATWCRNLGI